MMNQVMIECVIEILTKLYIEQEFKDKQKGKCTYVKKTQVYKDLLKWFKEMKSDEM